MNVSEKAMLVSLNVSCWTARKQDKTSTAEICATHGTTDKWARGNKTLVPQEEVKKVQAVANAARTYHYRVTLPWDDNGARILPSALFYDYSKEMRRYKVQFDSVVEDFKARYAGMIEDAKRNLNGLFNQADYPSLNDLGAYFGFNTDILPLPSAGDFRVNLSRDEVDSIKARIQAGADKRITEAHKDLWQRLYGVVSACANKLADPDAIFRDSLVENVKELSALLPKLNIVGDADLDKLAQEVESKLASEKPATLREDKQVRASVAKDARDILAAMAGYMGTASA